METTRPVRIARKATISPSPGSATTEPTLAPAPVTAPLTEARPNVGGSKRAFRVAVLFLVALAALYAGFAVYDRTAPGGSGSPATNGLWLFTAVFAVFAIVGIVYSLTPAPRFVEVATSRLTVVGRWGRRRRLPPMERLSIRVVRRYAPGFLSDRYVELVEVWGTDTPVRSYLVEEGIFSGAKPVDR